MTHHRVQRFLTQQRTYESDIYWNVSVSCELSFPVEIARNGNAASQMPSTPATLPVRLLLGKAFPSQQSSPKGQQLFVFQIWVLKKSVFPCVFWKFQFFFNGSWATSILGGNLPNSLSRRPLMNVLYDHNISSFTHTQIINQQFYARQNSHN